MEIVNLVDSFSEFKEVKNIDKISMISILEDIFRSMLVKKWGTDDQFDIIVNPDKGDLEIWLNRIVIEDHLLEDDYLQIPLSEAKLIDPDYEPGDEVAEPVKFEEFGRRNILSMRQILRSKVLDLDKDNLYKKYKDKVGEILTGEVYQVWKREIMILDDDGNELILPKSNQIPSDFFKKGDSVKAIVESVNIKNNTPIIILSRTSPRFLEKLMELEIPEIFDGLITIKNVARIPGERAKVSVESYDDRVDPVGACVGMKGSKIRNIVRELRGESIDIINWTNNTKLYITRALSPAKISSIELDSEKGIANVHLSSSELSLAIGKGGSNIKLTRELTGWEIDLYANDVETIEDVNLDEFLDEIDEWIIDQLKAIGCDTAMSVLNYEIDELVRRTDLEEETIVEVRRILQSEFDN